MKRIAFALTAISLSVSPAIADETDVTLINVFEVPEQSLEASIEMWKQSRDFLQTQPGYVSTALHQSISPDAQFRLINIAVWDSAEAFRAATAAMRATAGIKPVEGLTFVPGLYSVIEED